MSHKKPVITQDVIQVLKMLGLNISAQTGGHYCEEYKHLPITTNENGMYTLTSDDEKVISFLNSGLFLTTVKMVENSLNYKLFS